MKMHKKLYKAGKNWLVATIMTGAAVMTFSTINAHADQVIPGANSQPQASAVAQVQGPSANSHSQPVAQQANVKVAATIDNNQNLQQRINQVQQSVDQQTQVVKQQQAMVDQAWNDYSQKINQSVAIDDKVKSTSQAYNNQKAQADTLYDQYNSLYEKEMTIKAQRDQVLQGDQYQSLLQQAKALCLGYYTGSYSEKMQSVVDLQKNNLAQYNQFESLQKQMTDLLGNLPTQFSQAIDAAIVAFNKWRTVNDALENGSARQAYRDALAKQRDASAATQAANLVWNNAKQKLDQDQVQLATLTAQLTALKQQLHEQTLSCTVTYVDAQGRTVGTEVLSGKDGKTFTSADLHLPVNYQLATGTAVSITLNAQTTAVTVNVVSTPAKVVHVTVNFVDAQSQQQLGNQVLTGQPGQQFTDHDLTIPAGYVFDNASQGAFVITIGEQDDSTTIYLNRQQVKKTGFQHEDGGVFYYDQAGNRVMGEQVLDGHTYFFNPKANGLMATGIAEEKMGDPYYLFNDQGQKQGAGEHLYHGKWYYCDPNNNDAVATGFTKLPDGRTVYYSLTEGMAHGKQVIDGRPYNFANGDGHLEPGWTNNDGKYYYVNPDVSIASGEQCINGYWYYFDPKDNGAMVTGFYTLPGGKKVYYDEQGRMAHGERYIGGHNYQGGHWYNFDQRYGTELTGFQKLSDGRVVYYNQDGQMVHGTQMVNGHPYHFDNVNGALQTGWSTINGKTYYVTYANNNVAYTTGERAIGGYWYYFDPNDSGAMVTGFYTLPSGKKVYYDEQGRMAHGERYIGGHNYQGGHWYNFDQRYGTELTGFQKLSDGRVVYYNQDGQMLHGVQQIDGHPYRFDNSTGALQTGWSNIDGKIYYVNYANNNVAYSTGERFIGGYWYYFDPNDNGAMVTGFYNLPSGKKVYYDEQGRMAHGERYIGGHNYQGGHWYNFDQRYGTELTGFQKLSDGRVVYYNQDGQMVHGTQTVNGHPYHFDNSTGALKNGWNTFNGKTYYVNYVDNQTAYLTGERFISGCWYYFDPNDAGAMVTGFYTLPGGKKVYYDEQGRMAHGERYIGGHNYQGGHWYNFDQRYGTELTGFQKLSDGRTVYYNQDGQMVHGPLDLNGHHYYFNQVDGRMITGLFFNSDLKGLQYYNDDGQRQNGPVRLNNHTFNFNDAGDLMTGHGEQEINNQWYLFDNNGKLVTGFTTLPDKRVVYYDPTDGQMSHGERQINGKWYFFDYTDGHEYRNAFAHLHDGRTTYYDGDGHMVYGERSINGSWYHFDEGTGAMTKGFYSFPNGGKTVYYDNNGHMLHGWATINRNRYYFDGATGALNLNLTLINLWRSIINDYSNPISIAIQTKRDGRVYSYTNRPGHRWRMASTVKVSVLAQLLHNTGGSLNGYQQQLATNMIRNSDNNATQTIVTNYLGGDWNLRYVFSAVGMNETSASWHWGSSTTTASDQLKLLHEIYMSSGNGYLNQRSRDYIAGLMHSINPSQRWGISAGSGNYYVKNGWVPDPATNWCVNSIGYIPRNVNNGYTIAIYSDYNWSMQYGISIDERLARATANIVPWL